MQTRALLVLSFVIISVIPASLLSAISFFSLSRLEQSISNIYLGTVTIISNLSDGHKDLIEMRLNVGRLISATDDQQKQGILKQIEQNEGNFLRTLIGYKEIDDFPLQIDILQRRGLSNMTSYEDSLLTQVNDDWLEYQQARNMVITLTNEGSRENATAYSNTVAADRFSKLATSYNKIVDLNNNLASIMFDESQSVAKQAYTFAVITSASSIAFAVAAAFLISKRLAPSVDELQREARKKIEMFISKGIGGKGRGNDDSSKLATTISTNNVQKEKTSESTPSALIQTGRNNSDNNNNDNLVPEELEEQVGDLLQKGPMILLHFSQYKELMERQHASEDNQQQTRIRTVADSLLDYYLTTATGDASSSPSSSSTSLRTTSSSSPSSESSARDKKTNLVLITKRTSNLYSLGRNAGATIYVLSSSSQDPITTSADGLLVISINQTSLILEAIKRTLRENPNSVIVLDNITELIHKLGFAKVFSLIQSVSDEVSPYPNSRIIVLINENAHPRNEVEAIATICNAFIR
ncbi:Protein of unknown function (DUF835)/Four helix bundle sensory module for signal transduction [Candidatus Nitrososphaera evergladensis SR1]|uniref:Uncharacterized protein n=2 Tax=Nitrososphaera TaxID=497726 RepID=A0A075MMJ5_9ARCH|nr:Protein of unknown function (DUF835)/Four helix bundle sensory module for signal transduction [Candidatus Nitrososphaera evergladensis SR1]